jgi:hypothetical protein
MLHVQAMVDYEKFRSAKVAVFIHAADAGRTFQLLAEHGEAIARLAARFSARVLLVEEERLRPELIVEQELADAWVLLVTDGRNRAMTTRRNPQRINLDSRGDWELLAFRELLRQVRESTRIIADVTSYYSRYTLALEQPAAH